MKPYENLSLEDMEGEVWKDVVGYEGLYKVSNLGRVKSLERTKQMKYSRTGCSYIQKVHTCIKKQRIEPLGYLKITINKENIKKRVFVHVLVAKAFVPNTYSLPQVNHKDEDKTNNCVDNLEWCTALYNSNYGTRAERISKKQTNNRPDAKPILQCDKDGNIIREWLSISQAAREGNHDLRSIQHCLHSKYSYKTHHGYIWKFKNINQN